MEIHGKASNDENDVIFTSQHKSSKDPRKMKKNLDKSSDDENDVIFVRYDKPPKEQREAKKKLGKERNIFDVFGYSFK